MTGTMPMKIRIYIVDDHALFRKGLAALINAEQDMEVCGEGEDCAVATQNILRIKPDLVIVDISLKGNNGIELIKNIKAVEPQIQVVVLSMHDESIYALRVLRVGAKAYVMKQDAAESVVDAIRWVRKGQLYVSEFVASQMLNRYAQGEQLGDDSAVSCLSDRELEVLNLIGSGVSTREIAARLHVSIKTVETHRAHIKSKLNLGSASQLIQFCVRWVDQSPHVVRTDAGAESVDSQPPFVPPLTEVAPARKFAPAASITTLVRPRSRTVSTEKAG
jgi:DNA-binding NarL/FixJ family response regulator